MEEKIKKEIEGLMSGIAGEYGREVADSYTKRIMEILTQALSQSKKDVIEEIEKKWEERIIEAKQALYNEYGVNHKYTPHYEAILDDILLSLKDKEE